jgi:hypothetical protein
MVRARYVIPGKLMEKANSDPGLMATLAAEMGKEVWRNERYVALVTRGDAGEVVYLSVARADRKHPRDWRDLQRIKNELAGVETEAVELFPADSRLVDTANQTYLWCLPEGQRFPFGFLERQVAGPGDGEDFGQSQRELPDE